MKRAFRITAIAIAATVSVAAMARAQDDPGPPGPPADVESAEIGDIGPAMHDSGPGMEHGFGRRHGMGRRGPGAFGFGLGLEDMKELNLTDAQREQLANIRERHQKAAITTQADLHLAELELSKLMRAEKPDVQAIERQVDRISALRGTQLKSRLTGTLEARAVLTPAQQKKLRELRLERRQRSAPPRRSPRGT